MTTDRTYTIAEVEQAINTWRGRHAADESGALCGPARLLAEPYTRMFLAKRETIAEAELNAEQRDAMRGALDQTNLSF
jgi:hypothetical protein